MRFCQTHNLKILSVCEGNEELFIATNNGLFVLRQDSFFKLNFPLKLENEKIQSLLYSQAEKKLWAATPNGLLGYSNTNFEVINEKYGIASSAFNLKSVAKSKEGTIYWGTNRGILKYIPFKFKSFDIPRFVTIESIKVDGETNDWKKLKKDYKVDYDTLIKEIPFGLSLKNDFAKLEFSFNCVNWSRSELTNYYYRLKEQSENWIFFGNQGILVLQNLPAGNYKMEVKAELQDGITSKIIKYSFSITKPFYLELWFLILISVSILGIIWLVIKRFSEFSFDSPGLYGNDALLINKTRILAGLIIILTTGIDYFHGEINHHYAVYWPVNIALMLLAILLFAYTFYKGVNLNFLDKAIKISYLLTCFIYIHRAYFNDFNPLLSIETCVTFIFAVLIFKDIKNIVLFSVFILLSCFLFVLVIT